MRLGGLDARVVQAGVQVAAFLGRQHLRRQKEVPLGLVEVVPVEGALDQLAPKGAAACFFGRQSGGGGVNGFAGATQVFVRDFIGIEIRARELSDQQSGADRQKNKRNV